MASKSPRRIELLGLLGLPFAVAEPVCDEDVAGEASERVRKLALRKALSVSGEMGKNALVLGADTLVERGGAILGKPQDGQSAKEMLRMLSDGWHNVHTGVALVNLSGRMPILQRVESARVHFAQMPESFIEAYVASGEPLDKAGAYGIQGQAAAWIDRIEGDYYAIVGLPICAVRALIEETGMYNELKQYKMK